MKQAIHPDYQQITVTCVCGRKFNTGSKSKLEKNDICSECHPFYTGKQKVIDTEGRIEKFKKKFGTDYTSMQAPKKQKKK